MDPSAFTEKVDRLMASGTNVKSKSTEDVAEARQKESHKEAVSRRKS